MSGRVLFDTDVLIWYFRGLDAAAEIIARIPFEKRLVSSLCLMELIQGCRSKKELKEVNGFVKDTFSDVIHCDKTISERAVALLRLYALGYGLRTVDALVAATVITNEAALATGNFRHFEMIKGLDLMRFEPKSN